MRKAVYLLFVIVTWVSCSKPEARHDSEVGQAERLMECNPDSALAILEAIDPSDIKVDSLKAKFHYLKAYGHMSANRSMVGDSLISFAHDYYRGKDIVRIYGAAPHLHSTSSGLATLPVPFQCWTLFRD